MVSEICRYGIMANTEFKSLDSLSSALATNCHDLATAFHEFEPFLS
jgi:hypothetical protein